LWRAARLAFNFLLPAVVFTAAILILILLMNPSVTVSGAKLPFIFLDLFLFYGPLSFAAMAIIFAIVQFFSERRYPIGIVNPPTPTYILFFTILIVSVVLYANYDYYGEFFAASTRSKFFITLMLNFLLVVLGLVFLFSRRSRQVWLQALFLVVLAGSGFIAGRTILLVSPATTEIKHPSRFPPPALDTPRKIRIVIMDGLSLNLLFDLGGEQKLLNFNWIMENGGHGRISTFKPNQELALVNTLLSGYTPAEYGTHSEYKYRFRDAAGEFDIFPRYIFFRLSSHLGLVSFYKQTAPAFNDQLQGHYLASGQETFRMLRPDPPPTYAPRNLERNGAFIQFFSDALKKKDPKLEILKKAFFYDDYVKKLIPEVKASTGSRIGYALVSLEGLKTITNYFLQYSRPDLYGNLDEEEIQRYGSLVEKYYDYYDSIVGNLISTTGDDEMLVIMSFYEFEPLPVWRRALVKYFGRKDVFVYKPLNALGTILVYEKAALKKGYDLNTVSVYDLFPTLLYYAGFPLPKKLKGEVVKDMFNDYFLANNPVYFQID